MKKILHLAIISILAFNLTSCNEWLDVNDNMDSPTNLSASVAARLPWLQHSYGYAYGNASVTVASAIGHMASRSTNSAYEDYAPGLGSGPTTPYQQWFVDGASNVKDLIIKAEKEQAWHYIGAAKVVEAMGYVLMADIYGEMPFTEACSSSLTPVYDNGKTIYEGCLAKLDEALAMFAKEQPITATKLSKGDNWNNGDIQKWIKLCHGLKARWLNNMSKKSTYDPTTILAEIAKGPAGNADNSIVNHVNAVDDMDGDPLVGDPLKTSFVFDVAAWGSWGRINKWYMNILTNSFTGGTKDIDPRLEKLVPSCERWKDINGDGTKEKYWDMTEGVDLINGTVRVESSKAPMDPQFNTKTKQWYISATDTRRLGDTAYLQIRSLCAAIAGAGYDGNSTRTWGDGTVMTTGTFYSRPEAPTDIITYHEMCFIKAEILFRQGDKGGALTAYKEGIAAHINHMQAKLASYGGDKQNPGRNPMNQAAIDKFLSSKAVTGEITMTKIMLQKYVAMSFTVQNWNDMRRFDYSTPGKFGEVYADFDRPAAFKNTATNTQYFPGNSKSDVNYWFRRFRHCGHEINYNNANLTASNPKALAADIWSVPVWWDTTE
ncbi:MAG: SusD/RagB family nutrient-binding outer membrane lipoprotein [Bacteroidales bacterium]